MKYEHLVQLSATLKAQEQMNECQMQIMAAKMQALLRPGSGNSDVNAMLMDAEVGTAKPKMLLPEPDFDLYEIHKAQSLINEN